MHVEMRFLKLLHLHGLIMTETGYDTSVIQYAWTIRLHIACDML